MQLSRKPGPPQKPVSQVILHDRRDPAITGIDGLRATEVTVAAYRAACSGLMVKV